MKKLDSMVTYQLSLEDVKEALTLYMKQVHNTDIDITSINEVMKTEDYALSYDCITKFDGLKIYSR